MSIFNHNIYDNIRTRVIVLHKDRVLLLPIKSEAEDWSLPGGGLEPHETLAECAAREVWEETGVRATIGRVAFVREWVVPKYVVTPDQAAGAYGYGLEVYLYAAPTASLHTRPEVAGQLAPEWISVADVPQLRIWPNEIKSLARRLATGEQPAGCLMIGGRIEDSGLPGREVAW